MAIKFKITKTAFEKLSDDLKEAYKADGDHYVLDATGAPEPEGSAELTRALERIKAERDDLKDELKTTTEKLTAVEKTMTEGDRDVTKLTKRYETKLADQKAEFEGKLGTKDKIIIDGEVERAAEKIASTISTSPNVLKPHVLQRLTAEFGEDGRPVVKVLKDGKVSDVTLDKLGEEFVANKDFAAIIRASNASGGRATAPSAKPAMPGNSEQAPDLTKLSTADMVERVRAVKASQAA
jgi:hypothetical protein